MTTEPILPAQAIVRRYLAHGIPARLYRDGVIVQREEGWVGPLDPGELQTIHLADIERIEADARVAAVWVLCRQAAGWKQVILEQVRLDAELDRSYSLSLLMIRCGLRNRWSDLIVDHERLLQLLQSGGWDDERAALYASVAVALHRRRGLFRDLMD